MIQDMKTILTRLFTVMMLIMVSVAAGAQFVTVNIEWPASCLSISPSRAHSIKNPAAGLEEEQPSTDGMAIWATESDLRVLYSS